MSTSLRLLLLRYGCGVLTVALATAGRLMLDPALGTRYVLPAFYVAVFITIWYGGFGPALVSLTLGYLSVLYFFRPPRGSLWGHDLNQHVDLAIFATIGVFGAFLAESLGAAQRRAEVSAADSRRKQKELEHEIALRMQTQEALQASERRFRSLVEKSWDAFGLIDAQGTMSYGSPTTARILGYDPEELIGRNAFDLIHPDDQDDIRRLFLELLQNVGASTTAQYRFHHKDGSWRWLETTATNLLADPGVQAVVVNYRDITERKRLEAELQQRAAQLQTADRRKDEFLAMLAHELRNPLAPIRNALQIMKQPNADCSVVERVREMMERQVHHMTRMVDDLLDVSRITRGKIELRKEVIDLVSVVRRTMEATRPLIEDRHQVLTVSLPTQPLCLKADLTRLEQILANLLNNASKYTDQGGHIWLSAKHEGNDIVLRVKDTGMGVPADMLSRIFEPFVQSDRVLHHSQGGLGIGLTLVRSLVEMHGGTVSAHSDGPGKGTELVVHLPILSEKSNSEPIGTADQESQPPGATRKRRIVVVDDNVDAAESLALLLRLEGHDVRVAHDGPAALAAVDAHRPDIVLLDIGMPVMNGYEVAQRLRQQPGLEQLVLVAMTGWGQEEDRRRTKEAGFDHHLVKPAEPDVLNELLGNQYPRHQM
jgi:two-component system CheB/CheR fusion protein